MISSSPHPVTRSLAVALTLAVVTSLVFAAKPGQRKSVPIDPPPATDLGTFEGTWNRIVAKQQKAVLLRKAPEDGRWEIRFMWQIDRDQRLDTEWKTDTEFEYRGFPGSLHVEIDQELSNDRRIVADWRREQAGPRGSQLSEWGELVLYRAADGATLVWQHDALTRKATVAEPILPEEAEGREITEPVVEMYAKQSVRMLLWDEIYW